MSFRNRLINKFRTLPEKPSMARNQATPNQFGGYGYVARGGISNLQTGMGTVKDKTEYTMFTPSWFSDRSTLETIRVQSSAARKFVEMPVDDMVMRWRQWTDENNNQVEDMEDAEKRHNVKERLAKAMKLARMSGTGAAVMITKEDTLDTPLNVDLIRPGDFLNLFVTDRFNMAISMWDEEISSPGYGQPLIYNVFPQRGGSFQVHASRVLRFDGIQSLASDGWQVYDRDWGVSELVPALTNIIQHAQVYAASAHLTDELSVPVYKIDRFRDALATSGGSVEGDIGESVPSIESRAENANLMRSIYNAIYIDKDDDFGRVAVNLSGLPDLIDRFDKLLASIAQIPLTRFHGESPAGMNATGESDMVNYAIMIAAKQVNMLTAPLLVLDAVLAADAGIPEAPTYMWQSLIDLSDMDTALLEKARTETLRELVNAFVIDENEARKVVESFELFENSELEGDAPEKPEPVSQGGADSEPMDVEQV